MRDKVSGAIAIPRQAGDVPQPCRTGFGWYSQEQCLYETMQEWLLEKPIFSIRQKGDTPAFACQHAAIAPLPCSNL